MDCVLKLHKTAGSMKCSHAISLTASYIFFLDIHAIKQMWGWLHGKISWILSPGTQLIIRYLIIYIFGLYPMEMDKLVMELFFLFFPAFISEY